MAIKRSALLLALMLCAFSLKGAIVQINGKWSDNKYAPTVSIPGHFDRGAQAMEKKEWDEALQNFLVIAIHFPESPFYADALFYSGVCYYHLKDYDLANRQFAFYLNLPGNLRQFEKVFEYKLMIANAYSEGKKKHLFGTKRLPRLMPAKDDAIKLYDEVIAAVPAKEMAAKAYFAKADLLRARREYRESIEALQTLARRFPKHALASESYLTIAEIYLEESRRESQNPDLISLAELNLSRFKRSFPSDERIGVVAGHILSMKEVFASSLYDTGRFYERKKKPHASKIYYKEALRRYPETDMALKCRERLGILDNA